MIEIRLVRTLRERRAFLTFPWKIYKGDPLWVPPLLSQRAKSIDPKRGPFFRDGDAELFVAWKDGRPAGTICLAEERNNTRFKGFAEGMFGFVEVIDDYQVFAAMFQHAEAWARARGMRNLYGPYNLDREDCRGILIEGWDRPAALLLAHHPRYYGAFFDAYGFPKEGDGVAYAIDIDLTGRHVQRLIRVADGVRERHPNFKVRSANLADREAEIDRILYLQNRGLEHLATYVPYTRADIEAMIQPVLDLVDPDLVLFAEVDGKPAGFFPGIPNFNEVLIHLNGLRHPWDYARALLYGRRRPECIAIKSAVVPPEYRDTGLALMLFTEMAKRAATRGYKWADLSLTGDDNKDTWPLAHHMGATIYKRYRLYRKPL